MLNNDPASTRIAKEIGCSNIHSVPFLASRVASNASAELRAAETDGADDERGGRRTRDYKDLERIALEMAAMLHTQLHQQYSAFIQSSNLGVCPFCVIWGLSFLQGVVRTR